MTYMDNRLLKHAREAAALGQEDLAEAIGTTASTISDWERGEHYPSPYFREKLVTVLQRSAAELGLLPKSSEASSLYDPLLPVPIPLVGRQDYLTQLRQSVLVNRAKSVVLFGLPGVGKTALATMLAHDQKLRKQFSGILWIGLGPHATISDDFLRWGKLLGLSSSDLTDRSIGDTLRSTIGERSMLFIIDDVWECEDAQICQRIAGPNCHYVFTTRFPSLAPRLALTSMFRIEELNQDESMRFLRVLAPEVIEREKAKAVVLAEAVGGLPLALLLMGNYLRTQGYSGQSRRIQAALQRLSDAQERLQLSEIAGFGKNALSLQATLAISDQLLSEAARRSLHRLAVALPAKPQTFVEHTALSVMGTSVEELDMLVDTGFLECSEDRYTIHQVIADYARLHLPPETAR